MSKDLIFFIDKELFFYGCVLFKKAKKLFQQIDVDFFKVLVQSRRRAFGLSRHALHEQAKLHQKKMKIIFYEPVDKKKKRVIIKLKKR